MVFLCFGVDQTGRGPPTHPQEPTPPLWAHSQADSALSCIADTDLRIGVGRPGVRLPQRAHGLSALSLKKRNTGERGCRSGGGSRTRRERRNIYRRNGGAGCDEGGGRAWWSDCAGFVTTEVAPAPRAPQRRAPRQRAPRRRAPRRRAPRRTPRAQRRGPQSRPPARWEGQLQLRAAHEQGVV